MSQFQAIMLTLLSVSLILSIFDLMLAIHSYKHRNKK